MGYATVSDLLFNNLAVYDLGSCGGGGIFVRPDEQYNIFTPLPTTDFASQYEYKFCSRNIVIEILSRDEEVNLPIGKMKAIKVLRRYKEDLYGDVYYINEQYFIIKTIHNYHKDRGTGDYSFSLSRVL